ncbi:MAG: SusE domain-containing protein [Bacteroidales bacterium]|jgi:hypothetical protein|nr:SusE domain-containing protein [Bacteroidales bacterium]
MKATYIQLSFIIVLFSAFTACSDNMGDPDDKLTEVPALVEPVDGKAVVLETSAASSVYFEWEYVKTGESGVAVYQIAFDRADGDFSKPVYMMASDNNGYSNYATVTHKLLNRIAGRAGYLSSETGNLKWAVFSSKGEKTLRSSQVNTLTLTRLAGFDNIPVDVFVTGEASEGGTDLSKAHKMKAVATGEFEVYTKLTAGKPFYFTDADPAAPRAFYTSDELVREGDETVTVPADGIYRITLDFTTGACTSSLVTGMWFYFSPNGASLFELPYAGYGVFRATGQTVTFKQESWGRDQRYKFRMFMKTNGGADPEAEYEWATLNGTDSPPNDSSLESYYYLQLLNATSQWDNKWKLMEKFDGAPADYTVYLQADRPYTHSVE